MDKELVYRTLAYLIGYYKTHEETIINKDEIDAINFIIEKNETLQQELQKYKENYECILKQRDDITKNATQQIESLIDEKNKYKSLYENEKDHTDTLKRIIKEVKENLERHLTAKSYGNHKYELFGREYLEDILDLLKEIK